MRALKALSYEKFETFLKQILKHRERGIISVDEAFAKISDLVLTEVVPNTFEAEDTANNELFDKGIVMKTIRLFD